MIAARTRMVALVIGATALTMAPQVATIRSVLRGGFEDPDDAMRLVEVRAWMAGQPWFDVSAHRLDPPLGASMHWSRLVDVPTAGLIRLFGLVAAPPLGEALARVVVPTVLLLALYAGMVRLATVLGGVPARLPLVLGMVLSGVTLVQFGPGRIGHHAPETLCLVLMVAEAAASFDPARARQAGWAGALVALALSMSLETLPLIAGVCASMVAVWIWRGAAMAHALAWFAGALALALPLLFLATVGRDHWLAPVCDGYGAAHLGTGMIGALGALGLAAASGRLAAPPARLAAAGIVAGLVVAFLVVAYPACLRSPFAAVDPLVRAIWLDNVVESKPLVAFMRDRPMLGLTIVGPIVLGIAGTLVAAVTTTGTTRARFAMLGALAALGLAIGVWQVRIFASVAPLALCGGLPLVALARRRLRAKGMGLAASLAPMAILPFTATTWALALPGDPSSVSDARACLAPEAFAPLARLPPGRALAPIDDGSHLLVATPLDVFTAPYHRNNNGNRYAIDVFLATPEAAGAMLAARHVDAVLTCGEGDLDRLAERAPGSLAAALRAGHPPAYLRPLPLVGTPYHVFMVGAQR